MKTLGAVVLTIAAALIAVPPVVYAHGYYVISDYRGHKAVTNGVPHYGWYIESGPYRSADAAERATGAGDGPEWQYNVHRYFTFPVVTPRRPGQIPLVEPTP
ncbi:MAG: hypothetical protein WBG50_07670 [Desulfomonilaceae bacterium]